MQSGAGVAGVGPLAEGFQINIGGIQVGMEDLQHLGGHIAVGDVQVGESRFLGQLSCVVGVFEEDRRFSIGVSN